MKEFFSKNEIKLISNKLDIMEKYLVKKRNDFNKSLDQSEKKINIETIAQMFMIISFIKKIINDILVLKKKNIEEVKNIINEINFLLEVYNDKFIDKILSSEIEGDRDFYSFEGEQNFYKGKDDDYTLIYDFDTNELYTEETHESSYCLLYCQLMSIIEKIKYFREWYLKNMDEELNFDENEINYENSQKHKRF